MVLPQQHHPRGAHTPARRVCRHVGHGVRSRHSPPQLRQHPLICQLNSANSSSSSSSLHLSPAITACAVSQRTLGRERVVPLCSSHACPPSQQQQQQQQHELSDHSMRSPQLQQAAAVAQQAYPCSWWWRRLLLALLLLALAVTRTRAQCTSPPVTYTACPSALAAAQLLTGNSAFLPISNAAWSGPTAACTAAASSSILITSFGSCHYLGPSMPGGALVLSNGNATLAAALANPKGETSTVFNGTAQFGSTVFQDSDMMVVGNSAYGQTLYDGIVLSFDITPVASGPVVFSYVWGSEEYPSYAPAPGKTTATMNDVFGFFVWNGSSTHRNIALLPGTTNPVSVRTVNQQQSTYYYAPGNTDATGINGMSTLLNTSTINVTAGVRYTFKLSIADGGDAAIDSLVVIKAGSLTFALPVVLPSPSPSPAAVVASPSPAVASSPSPAPVNLTTNATVASPAAPDANATVASPAAPDANATVASPAAPEANTSEPSPAPANVTVPSPSPVEEPAASPAASPPEQPAASPAVQESPALDSPEPPALAVPSPSPVEEPAASPAASPPVQPAASPAVQESPALDSPEPPALAVPSPSPVEEPAASPAASPPEQPAASPAVQGSLALDSPEPPALAVPSPSPVEEPAASPAASPLLNVSSASPEPSPALNASSSSPAPPGGSSSSPGPGLLASASPSPSPDSQQALPDYVLSLPVLVPLTMPLNDSGIHVRSMAWVWNRRIFAWTTQVALSGKLMLTREEVVANGTVVNSETLEPVTSGELNLFSSWYPGPGFTGTYDWSGVLEMQPNPFQLWGIGSSTGTSRRRGLLWGAPEQSSVDDVHGWSGHQMRSLLQSGSDASLPVQGRVSVRESQVGDSASGAPASVLAPGSVAAIDGEIEALVPLTPPLGVLSSDPMIEDARPLAQASQQPAAEPAAPSLPPGIVAAFQELVRVFQNPANQRTMIIVAAVVAPLALALVAVCAVVMRRRSRRAAERQQELAAEGEEQQPEGAADERPGGLEAAASAALDGTDVQVLEAGETGWGSTNGGAILPPSTDGTASGAKPASHGSLAGRFRASLTGMVAGVGAAFSARMSASGGGAYRVPGQGRKTRSSLDAGPGGLVRGASIDLPPTLRRREPTLPGGATGRRSVDRGDASSAFNPLFDPHPSAISGLRPSPPLPAAAAAASRRALVGAAGGGDAPAEAVAQAVELPRSRRPQARHTAAAVASAGERGGGNAQQPAGAGIGRWDAQGSSGRAHAHRSLDAAWAAVASGGAQSDSSALPRSPRTPPAVGNWGEQ